MLKRFFKIAIPVAIQQLIMSANSLLDNFMVSGLGDAAVAATGSANKFMQLTRLILIGIVSGGAILIPQYRVKNDEKGMDQSFIMSLLIAVIFALGFALFYSINRYNIVNSFSQDPIIRTFAKQYLDINILSSIVLAFLFPRMTSLRSRGKINFPFVLTTSMLVINFLFNYLLIYGNYGFPKLGIQGAAIATLISEVAVTVIAFLVASKSGYNILYSLENVRKLSIGFVKKYMNISLPIIFSNLLWSLSLVLIHNVFGMLGNSDLAAFGIMTPIEQLVIYMFAGFGMATLIIVGGELSQNNFDKAYSHAKDISLIGITIATIIGFLVYFNSHLLVSLYNIEPESKIKIIEMVNIFGLFLWLKIFNSISFNGIFRSGGDSKFLLWVVTIVSWLITLPIVYLEYYMGCGYKTIYITINCTEIILSLVFIQRFRSRKWMRNLSETPE